MKVEFRESRDGECELTVTFESRQDMDKFSAVYGKFSALMPDRPREEAPWQATPPTTRDAE